jgi:uncharacterized protein (DUF1778 family)
MSATPEPATTRETVNLRVPPSTRGLIDRAATLTGKTRTQFMLDASRRAAEEAVLDQALLRAEPDAYAAFVERLDRPAAPNERLRRTMQTPPPWGDEAPTKTDPA